MFQKNKCKSLVLVNFSLTSSEEDALKLFEFNNYIFIKQPRFFIASFFHALFKYGISYQKVHVFHETSPLVLLHYLKKEVILLEHGISNYIDMANDFYETKKYHFFKRYILRNNWIGESPFIDKIYLRKMVCCPYALLRKASYLDLSYYFGHLKGKNLSALNKVFGFLSFQMDNVDDGYFVILTQPFSEEGIMTETRKIAMYRFILSQIGTNVLIKPHPKEITNYKAHFSDIRILNSKIPFELFALNNIFFNRYITVTSSSTSEIDIDKVIVYGEDFLNEWK
jgi:hypothetical protein